MIRERDYTEVLNALTPVLCKPPPKIIAINGRNGVGKTQLGRYLAYRFDVTLIETDLFLIEDQDRYVHRNDEIARIIAKRLEGFRWHVIVEGVTVLRLLSQLKRKPDFTIYITNKQVTEIGGPFPKDLQAYEAEFLPHKANLTFDFTPD